MAATIPSEDTTLLFGHEPDDLIIVYISYENLTYENIKYLDAPKEGHNLIPLWYGINIISRCHGRYFGAGEISFCNREEMAELAIKEVQQHLKNSTWQPTKIKFLSTFCFVTFNNTSPLNLKK